MRIRRKAETSAPDLRSRIQEVERQAGEAVAASNERLAAEEARPATTAPRVPQPRMVRAFLFHGAAGERSFGQLTLLGEPSNPSV